MQEGLPKSVLGYNVFQKRLGTSLVQDVLKGLSKADFVLKKILVSGLGPTKISLGLFYVIFV